MAFEPGERVGDYEVVSVLGKGGMGKVYKVRNVLSDRVEAMKVLLPDFRENPELADRFMREIKVQASLSHPNIAQLHTAMRHNNELLMLMEYAEGTAIDEMLKWGPVPPAKAAAYGIQVLQALSYAHARGVIHRDIKPANIMVSNDGKVKLLDFGIARMKADKRLTQTGVTVGSLYYMSPEQINGGELDPRSDLYSLGVTLYEMVTGKRPFDAPSDFSIMAAHLNQDPVPPIQIDPTLPPVLNDIILMSTLRDPAQRFQSADAFGVALTQVAQTPGLGTATFETPPVAKAAGPAPRVTAPPAAGSIAAAGNASRTVAHTPPAPPVAKPGRGLYMALGSVVTVAVIVVAAIQLPKYLHTKADQPAVSTPASVQAPATQPTGPAAGMDQPADAPAVKAGQTEEPAPQGPATRQAASVPASSQRAANVQRQEPTAPHPTVQQPPQQIQQSPPQQQAQVPAQQQQAPAQAVPQATAPQSAAPVQPAGPSAGEVNAVRDRMMKLAARVGAVQTKARSMESAQRAQGLGMRSDVSSGVSRLTYYMDEAENALRSNDLERARSTLRRADQETETLERILGII